jgi:hypothetical protein
MFTFLCKLLIEGTPNFTINLEISHAKFSAVIFSEYGIWIDRALDLSFT